MAEHDATSWEDLPVLRDAIAASLGGAYWRVDDGGWSGPDPSLPDGVGDLLAPPLVVGAAPRPPEVDVPEMPSAPAVEGVAPGADPLTRIVADLPPRTVAPARIVCDIQASPRILSDIATVGSTSPGRHRRIARVA